MRIAQIAPLWESVPPPKYGAVESIVSELTSELVRRGHDVTVFASGDSKTAGRVRSGSRIALSRDSRVKEPEVYRFLQLQDVLDSAGQFDIIHSHIHSNTGCLGVMALSGAPTPVVHTVHCYINQDNSKIFNRFANQNFVSISNNQRSFLPNINWTATIYHGLDVARIPFRDSAANPPYVAFLGRIRADKGTHLAIEAAKRCGIPIKVAGRIKNADKPYFNERIKPHLSSRGVEFLGELGSSDKFSLIGGAQATLFPSVLPEPFGLVVIESMATGTPVIALNYGAPRELIIDGETGFLSESVAGFSQLIGKTVGLDRDTCRAHVIAKYSLRRMVDDYERAYFRIARSAAGSTPIRPSWNGKASTDAP